MNSWDRDQGGAAILHPHPHQLIDKLPAYHVVG